MLLGAPSTFRDKSALEPEVKTGNRGRYKVNPDTGATVWSKATFRIFGLSPGSRAPNAKAFTSMIHPEDRHVICTLVNRCILEKKRFDLIYRVVRTNGEVKFVRSIAALRKIKSGKDIMFGTFQDITGSHQATEALRISQDILHSLAESSSHHVFMLDPDGTFIASNDRVHHLGVSSGVELVGRSIAATCSPDVASLYQAHVDEIRKSRRQTVFEYTAWGPNNTRYHRVSLSPILRNGMLWAVGGTSRDITEQKTAPLAIGEGESKFRLLYEDGPLACQSIDSHGVLVDVNHAWLRLLGYGREEVVGRPLTELLDEPFWNAQIADDVPVELTLVKKDGSRIAIAFVCRSGQSAEGKSNVRHCILHDMTEQRRLEKQLRESQELLKLRGLELERKNLALQELILHLQNPASGTVSAERRALAQEAIHVPKELSVLSPRELQVCLQVNRGLSSKEIALQMGISPRSVETHRTNLRRKLGISGMNLSAYLSTLLGLHSAEM